MSVIALTSNGISGDFEILFDDETDGGDGVAGLRMIRRAAGATTTVHTTQSLYSAVADKSDEFLAMGFKNPMLPVTPNAFTMENNYFLPRSSTEFLKDGAIEADWTVASGDGVLRKPHDNTGTAPDANDIGYQVTETTSGHTGTLLDYELEPDGLTYVLWIRPDSAADTFALSTNLACTSGMSVTGTAAANSGVSLWSSIQAIGAVPSATEVYIYQNRTKMTDWEGNFQWWATDPAVSLGIIDILIRVQNADDSVADGDVEVFGRRYTSLFDQFRLNVAGGGRSALPLSSAPDINNTTGYQHMAVSAGSNDFDNGNGVYVGGTWATATKRGIVTGTTGTGPTTDIEYYLIGDLTDFANSDSLKEYDFSTEADGDATGTAGTPAFNPGGPTDPGAGEGGSVTITLGTIAGDHNQNGTNEYYSVEIDAQTDVAIAKVYERIKYACRRGADAADLFGAGTEMPGESYRGMDGLFEYDANTGALTEGDNILTTTGGNTWTAILMAQTTADTPDYITVMDQQTSLDSVIDDNVIEDEAGGDDVTVHAGGTLGLQNFTSPKTSPFGTFTGTQIFGARGVLFVNPASADTQAYILTDNLGDLYSPPNTVSLLIDKTIAGDRVLAARDTGTLGVIDKDQFGGMTATGASATSITVGGSIDTEVPASGWLRVVADDEQQEHRYVYSGRTTGASGVFTLQAVTPGTADAGTGATALVDAAADFVTDGVTPGMLIQDTTNGGTYEVVSRTDLNNLVIQFLYGTGGFGDTDAYTINETIQSYDTSDRLFDLIIDAEATGTSINNSFVKTEAADFGVVVNVRQGKVIIPFTQNQNVSDNGATVTVVRTPDTIAT